MAFQDPHDRNYGVPIPCRRRHAEQFVDLAKIADRFHVTTVHSEDESVFRPDDSHQPPPTWGKGDWNGSLAAPGVRKNAHEWHNIRAGRLRSTRMPRRHADKLAARRQRESRCE